jgi:hypothetical protein
MMRTALIGLTVALLLGVGAGLAQAVVEGDHELPFWTDTDPNFDAGTGRYTDANGAGWYVGRNDQLSRLFTSASPGVSPFGGPQFDAANNEWSWLNPGTLVNSGNVFYREGELAATEIINQFPRSILVFQAPAAGNFSVRGIAKYDWMMTNPDNNPADPNQISQLRAEFYSWAAIDPTNPTLGFAPGTASTTTLAHGGDLGVDAAAQPLGTVTVDLSTIPGLQDIALDQGDFLGIRVGVRGILSLNAENPVFDNGTLQLASDPSNKVRIFGPIPEPASMALLALGGMVIMGRRR